MPRYPAHRILVVDDEPDIRAYISSFLRKRYHVEVADAADGEAAIEMARVFAPDVMLLDIQMSKLSGWDVVKEVRKFNATVKIIIITGKESLNEEQRELVHRHVAAFLRKPFILEKVVEKMLEVLGTDVRRPVIARAKGVGQARGKPIGKARDARASSHAMANMHARVRLKCEYFVSNFEQGYFKDKTEKELLGESVGIFKDIIASIDKADKPVAKSGK